MVRRTEDRKPRARLGQARDTRTHAVAPPLE